MAKDAQCSSEVNNERDAAYDKVKAKQEGSAKAKNVLRGAGYARGGGVSPAKAVHKHEKHLHKGEKETKFKTGGKVGGKKTEMRADKFSRGGSKPRGHTKININVGAGQDEKKQAMMQGMQLGAKMAATPRPGAGAPVQARPPMPPPGGAPGGGMPGGMPPGGQPPMANRGGRFKKGGPVRVAGVPHLKGGAGGAKGRLSKMASYGTKPKA